MPSDQGLTRQQKAARTIGLKGYRKLGVKGAQTRAIRSEVTKAKRQLTAITKKLKAIQQALDKIYKNTGSSKQPSQSR